MSTTHSGVQIYDMSGKTPVLGKVSHEELEIALTSGRYSLPQGATIAVVSPEGELGTVSSEEMVSALGAGYRYATPAMIRDYESRTWWKKKESELWFGTAKLNDDAMARANANPVWRFSGEVLGALVLTSLILFCLKRLRRKLKFNKNQWSDRPATLLFCGLGWSISSGGLHALFIVSIVAICWLLKFFAFRGWALLRRLRMPDVSIKLSIDLASKEAVVEPKKRVVE